MIDTLPSDLLEMVYNKLSIRDKVALRAAFRYQPRNNPSPNDENNLIALYLLGKTVYQESKPDFMMLPLLVRNVITKHIDDPTVIEFCKIVPYKTIPEHDLIKHITDNTLHQVDISRLDISDSDSVDFILSLTYAITKSATAQTFQLLLSSPYLVKIMDPVIANPTRRLVHMTIDWGNTALVHFMKTHPKFCAHVSDYFYSSNFQMCFQSVCMLNCMKNVGMIPLPEISSLMMQKALEKMDLTTYRFYKDWKQ